MSNWLFSTYPLIFSTVTLMAELSLRFKPPHWDPILSKFMKCSRHKVYTLEAWKDSTPNNEGHIPSLRDLTSLGHEVLKPWLHHHSLKIIGSKGIFAQRLQEALHAKQASGLGDSNISATPQQVTLVS